MKSNNIKHLLIMFTASLFFLNAYANIQDEKRIALVIGNTTYQNVGSLPNAKNDALLIKKSLEQINFEVIYAEDASAYEMEQNITLFGEKLKTSDVGLFYYAGHASQYKGANYLIPTDLPPNMEAESAKWKSIHVNFVVEQMENANNTTNIIILDSCRDNPFDKKTRSLGTTRTRGMAQINSHANGMYIAYSTSANDVATDGDGNNSPYTLALSKNILKPGLSIHQVFTNVTREVKQVTKGDQRPWAHSSLDGEFYFASPVEDIAKSSNPNQTSTELPSSAEFMFWNEVKASDDIELLEAYIQQYPQGYFITLAKLKIKRLASNSNGSINNQPSLEEDLSESKPAAVNNNPKLLTVLLGKEPRNNIQLSLEKCDQHLKANRLTTGKNGNAFDCYQNVLKTDLNNSVALAGLVKIEDNYMALIKRELNKSNPDQASSYLNRLIKVNANHQSVARFTNEINNLRNDTARREEQNKAEITLNAKLKQKQQAKLDQKSKEEEQTRLKQNAKQEEQTKVYSMNKICLDQFNQKTSSSVERAINCYLNVLNKYPGNPDANNGLASIESYYENIITREIERKKYQKAQESIASLNKLDTSKAYQYQQRLEQHRKKNKSKIKMTGAF